MTIVRDGEVTFPPPQISVSVAPQKPAAAPVQEEKKPANPLFKYLALAGIVALMFLVGAFAPESFLPHFTVFVLSCVVGYYVVWNVRDYIGQIMDSFNSEILGAMNIKSYSLRRPSLIKNTDKGLLYADVLRSFPYFVFVGDDNYNREWVFNLVGGGDGYFLGKF